MEWQMQREGTAPPTERFHTDVRSDVQSRVPTLADAARTAQRYGDYRTQDFARNAIATRTGVRPPPSAVRGERTKRNHKKRSAGR